MDVARFIESLEVRGLRLAPEGDPIVLRGPKGELISAIIELVAAHKPELLAYLQQRVVPVPPQADALEHLQRIAALGHLHRAGAPPGESARGEAGGRGAASGRRRPSARGSGRAGYATPAVGASGSS